MKDNAKTAALAALATRAAKNGSLDREELRAGWLKEAKELGFDKERLENSRREVTRRAAMKVPGVTRAGSPPAPNMADAIESVKKAISHTSEHNVYYNETTLLTNAIAFAEKADLTAIGHAIEEAKRNGTLITVKDKTGDTGLLTDHKSLNLEREMSRIFRKGMRTPSLKLSSYKNNYGKRNFRPETALRNRLARTTLTDGQKDSIQTSLTGKGQFVGVQGYAGTGKTYMLKQLAKEADRAGYKIEGLAPSKQAVAQLQDALPSSETLQARLLRQKSLDREADPRKTILVVDESSMVSTNQMEKLLQQANEQKIARVVLVGDVKQMDAVSAGTPFALLQKLGMRTAVMDDIQRQRDGDTLAVVKHAIAGEVQEAFEKIGKGIVTVEDIASGAAKTYLTALPQDRKGMGLVTPTNRVREAINTHIREGLRNEGALQGEDHTITTLTPQRLSRVEAADPRSYRVGDVVVPHQSVASAGLTKGRMYDVIDVKTDKQTVILQERGGTTPLPFSPTQKSKAAASVDTYEEKTRDFAVGDDVKFRITDQKQGIENGQAAKITAIDSDAIYLKDANGREFEVAQGTLAASGLDHAYALTTHDFQGATVNRIVVAMTANEQLANQKSFYVSVSRARDDVTLITDNAEKLANRLEAQTGEKISALEAYIEAKKQQRLDRTEKTKEEHNTEKERQPEPSTDITLEHKKDKQEQPTLADLYKQLDEALQKQRGDYER